MNNKLIQSVARALITAMISTLVLLLCVNAAILAAPDPDALSGMLGIVILIVSALAGGVAAARTSYEKPIVTAAVFAGIYLLLHCAAHLIFGDGQGSFVNMLVSYVGAFAAAVLGCIVTKPKRTKGSKGIRKFKKYSKRMHG